MARASTIAVVDDDRAVRSGISSLLRASGFGVATFDSAEALISASGHPPSSLIIADYRMPGMTGIALLQTFRAAGDLTPFIIITALPSLSVVEAAHEAGAIACLRKPFEHAVLLALVHQVCDQPDS